MPNVTTSNIIQQIRKLSTMLSIVASLVLACLLEPLMSEHVMSVFYTISAVIKEVIIFVLPFIIFALLWHTLTGMMGSGLLNFLIFIIPAIIMSNFIAGYFAYAVFNLSLGHMHMDSVPEAVNSNIKEYFALHLPDILNTKVTLILALLVSVICHRINPDKNRKYAEISQKYAYFILSKILPGIIPLFIFGFIMKMKHDGYFTIAVHNYGSICIISTLSTAIYILFLTSVSAKFSIKKIASMLSNIVPPAITALGTMSSMATMPLTIVAAENNTSKPLLSRAVIATTVNYHLIGDVVGPNIFALITLFSFGADLPSFGDYTVFLFYATISKFFVATVPGGGLYVLLPILTAYLNFTPQMLSIFSAVYLLYDPIITVFNVTGNIAFNSLFTMAYKTDLNVEHANKLESK